MAFTILGLVPISMAAGDDGASTGQIGPVFLVEQQHPIGRAYGVCHGELENATNIDSSAISRTYSGWSRNDWPWGWFQTSAIDNFTNLHNLDDRYQKFTDNMTSLGIKILPILDYSTGWLDPVSGVYIPPANISLWQRFVNETVTEYQNHMNLWEVWNEPNNFYGVAENASWDDFFLILITAARTIKLINNSLEVLVGGLGGANEHAFLDALMKNITMTPADVPGYDTVKDLFIGIAFHPYNGVPEDLALSLSRYDEILSKYNWTTKQGARHWITEIGSDTDSMRDGFGGGIVNVQREFAALVVKQTTIATSWLLDGLIWYEYQDNEYPGVFNAIGAEHMGIIYINGTWKPAAYAWNWTNRYLGNGHVDLMPVQVPRPITGIVAKDQHLYGGLERWIVVAWNPYNAGRVPTRLQFNTAITRASLHDYASPGVTDLMPSSDSIVIDIGYEPILLVIDCPVGANCIIIPGADALGIIFWILLGLSLGLLSITGLMTLRRSIKNART